MCQLIFFRVAGSPRESSGRRPETSSVPRDWHHKWRDVCLCQKFWTALGSIQLGFTLSVVHSDYAWHNEGAAGYHAGVQDPGDGWRFVRHGQVILFWVGWLWRKDGDLGRRKSRTLVQSMYDVFPVWPYLYFHTPSEVTIYVLQIFIRDSIYIYFLKIFV